jgi:hypothetical protein
MFPVSGAEQFRHSEANGFFPRLEQLELAGRVAPPISAAFAECIELLGDRLDFVLDELLHCLVQRNCLL